MRPCWCLHAYVFCVCAFLSHCYTFFLTFELLSVVLGLYCDYFKRMPMFFWRLAYYIPFTVLRHCNFVTCVFLRICSLLHVFSAFLSISAISFSVHLDVNFHCSGLFLHIQMLQLMHTFSAFSHDFLTAPGLLYWFVRFSLRMRTFFGVCERFSYCSSFFSAQLFSSYFLRIRGIYSSLLKLTNCITHGDETWYACVLHRYHGNK